MITDLLVVLKYWFGNSSEGHGWPKGGMTITKYKPENRVFSSVLENFHCEKSEKKTIMFETR